MPITLAKKCQTCSYKPIHCLDCPINPEKTPSTILSELKELIEKERDLAAIERDGKHFHTLEEFKVFEAKEELCKLLLNSLVNPDDL